MLLLSFFRTMIALMIWGRDIANTHYPLHKACKQGDFEKVKQLVQLGYDVNLNISEDKEYDSVIPLLYAAIGGHSNIIRYLIRHGALLYISNNNITSFNIFDYLSMKDAKWAFKVACMSETLTDDFHFVKDIQGNNTIHYAAYSY